MANAGDFLNLLAEYLEGNAVASVKTGVFPQSPDNLVALIGIPGNTVQDGRDVPELQYPRFQAIVRNSDYEDGSTAFQLIRQLLHGKINLILPTDADVEEDPYLRVLRCHADQEGGPIGQDDQGRYEFSINFTAEYHYVDTA